MFKPVFIDCRTENGTGEGPKLDFNRETYDLRKKVRFSIIPQSVSGRRFLTFDGIFW